MPAKFRDIPAAFWAQVDKSAGPDSCWLWIGPVRPNGYGEFMCRATRSRYRLAHRAAMFLTHGELPPDLDVCHACDNRLCVNPAHLWLGSRKENIRDCIDKGRFYLHSVAGWNKRVTDEQRASIRARRSAGERGVDIARDLKISPSTVYNIANGWHR